MQVNKYVFPYCADGTDFCIELSGGTSCGEAACDEVSCGEVSGYEFSGCGTCCRDVLWYNSRGDTCSDQNSSKSGLESGQSGDQR